MKILFFLLLTLFFATIGFAEVSHQSDKTNKKIEKIEEKLDTTKEELTKYTQITEDTKERVGDISSSVDRFTTALSIFGTLVTIVLIFVAWSSRNSAISEAKNTAQEEAQKQFDKWVKEKAKDFAEKEVHFEKIMNDKIKLFEDNVDVKTIQIMFENAVGYGRNKQYTEALKSYDEIIRSYAKSQNETISVKVVMSIFNKGVTLSEMDKTDEAIKIYDELISTYTDSKIDEIIESVAIAKIKKGITLGQLNKPDEAIKIYEKFITTYKDSKIERIREVLILAIQNKLEIEVILDKPISDDKILLEKLNQTSKDMAIIDMLLLLQNAKTSLQDSELQSWLEKYKDVKYSGWGFDELYRWIERATDGEEVKQRIRSYIETFKTHLHRA
ncbi:tol-pal system YbgF family protein [Sulfuricurvum sp.]|uniref:tol-pal system YbgF family protein n=1 Tax=Sulfuricurvum sp. TaxID=2025608 RepID=UPI0035613341